MNKLRVLSMLSLSCVLLGCEALSGINTSQFEPSARGVINGLPLGSRHFNDLQKDGVILADSREGTHIILPADRIFYQTTDRVIINPDYQSVLNNLLHILQGYPAVKFQIVGHTDGVMSPSLQEKQSSEFAYVIANYLTAAGMSPTRITSVRGVADRQPMDHRNNAVARELNRRVEIITEAPIH